jgi:hypothetical protein
MQQQRRVYAGEGRNSGVIAHASPEEVSYDLDVVNFLLRILPKQSLLMESLRDNSEIVNVDVDLMEWVDADYESEHYSSAAICNSIVFNFPKFYKNLSLVCDHLRSATSNLASHRAIHSSQLRCNIKLPSAETLFSSTSGFEKKRIVYLSGRIVSVQSEKQVVKSRAFSCSNDSCRLFSKHVTQYHWFFDEIESTAVSECSSCKLCCMFEDISACQVAEHQTWMVAFSKECFGRSMLCPVSVYENILNIPQLYLGCQVEMVILCQHFSFLLEAFFTHIYR